MSGIAGHKHSYSARVKIGNWSEDAAGAALSKRIADPSAGHPKLEISEHTARYGPPTGFTPSVPALRGLDALDGHLMTAHGPVDSLAYRGPAPTQYETIAQAVFKGKTTQEIMSNKSDVTILRTELMRSKAKMVSASCHWRCACNAHVCCFHRTLTRRHHLFLSCLQRSAGIDPWDPPALVPPALSAQASVTPVIAPELGVTSGAPAPAQHYAPVNSTLLTNAATLAATQTGASKAFVRDGKFTKQFNRGIGGWST